MADTVEKMRPHGRGKKKSPRMRRQENRLRRASLKGGNVGKYRRLKGGKNSREKQRIRCPLEGRGEKC